MPRSILRISIWNFNLVFGPHALSKTFFFFVFFSDKFWSLLLFFRIVISVIFRTPPPTEAGFQFLGWCMINIDRVKKSHPNTWKWSGHAQSTALAVAWLAQLVHQRWKNGFHQKFAGLVADRFELVMLSYIITSPKKSAGRQTTTSFGPNNTKKRVKTGWKSSGFLFSSDKFFFSCEIYENGSCLQIPY